MITESTRLAVTPIGCVVAQSVLHPRSADQLIKYAAGRAEDLLSLTQDESGEKTLRYVFLHAAYSSDEYNLRYGAKSLPYQLEGLVSNALADQSEDFLIERPWIRNEKPANAAMVVMRWAEGRPRNELAREFQYIGSGVCQTMFQEGAQILFAWSDCLTASTIPHLVDKERPKALRGDPDLLRSLRYLASAIRTQAVPIVVGLPGEVTWIYRLTAEASVQRFLSRPAILALFNRRLIDPVDLLRHDKFAEIIDAFTSVGVPDPNNAAQSLKNAVRKYRQDRRKSLWESAIGRAPERLKALLEKTVSACGKDFEERVETLLDEVGIEYERLDDGRTPGAPDLCLELNQTGGIVTELKTAQNDGLVGLNESTDVIKGAAIVKLDHLPKVTLANPGFDPNVPWQARKIRDLALVEACQFAYGISLLACGGVDKAVFLNWLARPGLLSVGQLRGSPTGVWYS